jgi:c-di-GMP-binding flagellar brake protein YcgR
MIPNRERVDRRKHKRYQVPTNSYTSLGSDDPVLGQIIEISMGGIAFRYMGGGKLPDESHLDIFLTEGDLCLRGVPFKTVSDFKIPNTVLCKTVEPIPPSFRTMRRSGLQFGELTPDQKVQLERFIKDHTLVEAS